MCLVTPLAITGSHFRTMRFVALGTEWYFAMRVVTETAGEAGMLALDLFQFDDLLSVAGKALIGDIISQLDNFRGMRIVVATETTGEIVMRLATVALAADRNDFLDCRRMADVTILATYLSFVGSAIGSNRFGRRRVALDTIGITQHRHWICRSGSQHCHSHQQCRQSDNF
jgi:hypothetical protein